MIRFRTALSAGGLLVVLSLSLATRAGAQVPAPPPETAPVFELIAPTVSPLCGNALLAVAIAPGIINGQVGGALPIDLLLPAFGPVVEICGAVPGPPARVSCDPDLSVQSTINTITGTAVGTQLPFGLNVFGAAVEQVIVIQDMLPPPASTTGLADQVVATLNCKAAAAPKAPTSPSAPATDASSDTTPTDLPTDLTAVSGFDANALPPLDRTSGPIEAGAGAPLPVTPVAQLSGPGFAYPVVFALPLVLLIVGGYLGRALTRPVDPPQG